MQIHRHTLIMVVIHVNWMHELPVDGSTITSFWLVCSFIVVIFSCRFSSSFLFFFVLMLMRLLLLYYVMICTEIDSISVWIGCVNTKKRIFLCFVFFPVFFLWNSKSSSFSRLSFTRCHTIISYADRILRIHPFFPFGSILLLETFTLCFVFFRCSPYKCAHFLSYFQQAKIPMCCARFAVIHVALFYALAAVAVACCLNFSCLI